MTLCVVLWRCTNLILTLTLTFNLKIKLECNAGRLATFKCVLAIMVSMLYLQLLVLLCHYLFHAFKKFANEQLHV